MKFTARCMLGAFVLMASCNVEKPSPQTEYKNGICFYKYDNMKENLPDKFVQTLLSGDKEEILSVSEQYNFRVTGGALEMGGCPLSEYPKNSYRLTFRPPTQVDYAMGSLDLYFENERLVAAEVYMILAPWKVPFQD